MLTVDYERLRIEPGLMTLDAGCGQGRHSLELVRRRCPGVAMDLNHQHLKYTSYILAALMREMEGASGGTVRKGKSRHRSRGRNFLVMRGDALHLPFRSEYFDRIICSEVLEHVHDPGQALAELARVLKPGGLMALSVPTPFSEWAYWFASDDYFNTPGGHVRIFTPRGLAKLVAAHGLQVVDFNFEHAFHTLYWWVRGVFGLHNEQHPVIHHFRKVLTYVMFSRFLTWAEGLLNYVIPKSMVLYARKTGRQEL